MDYFPFAAMVIAAAAGLAGLMAWWVLPARMREAGTVVAILGVAVIAFGTNLPGPLHTRLFGTSSDGKLPGGGFLSDWLGGLSEGVSRGISDSYAQQLADQIKAGMRAQNYDWLFDGDADLDSFARQVVTEGGSDPEGLTQAMARLVAERAEKRMGLLHKARLAEVTGVVTGVLDSLAYFIEKAQFGNCRTFLLGGFEFPGTDPQVMAVLADRLGAAVKSGQRGEKDWVEVGAAEMDQYTQRAVDSLLDEGYTPEQLGAMARLDTNDPAEMESNCRFTRDLFAHLVREYPPEVAATAYVSAL